MPSDLLATLLLQILVIGYSPGPANIYALTMSLRYGRRASIVTWLGLLAGFSVAVSIIAISTHFLGIAIGGYVRYLKYFGAAYLLYLSYKMWKDSGLPKEDNRGCTFINGFIMQLTNAKMILFAISVFSTFVLPYSEKIEDLFEVSAWLLLAGPGSNLVWLFAGSMLRRFFERYHKQVDTVSAIALLLCAIYIVL